MSYKSVLLGVSTMLLFMAPGKLSSQESFFLVESILNEKTFFSVLPFRFSGNALDAGVSSLYKVDVRRMNAEAVPSSLQEYLPSWFSLSPDGQKLGIIYSGAKDGNGITNNKLVLHDLRDHREETIDNNVNTITWSPKSEAFSYITGVDLEGFPGFSCTGLKIYHFATKEKIEIPGCGYDIYWSPHDGNIYVTDFQEVRMYNVNNKSMTKTAHHGIVFSPDGKYYSNRNYEGSPLEIYNVADDSPDQLINNAISQIASYCSLLAWLNNGKSIFIAKGNEQNFVLDMETGKIIRSFDGWVVGIDWKREYCLVHDLIAEGEKKGAIDRDRVRLMKILE